MTDQKQNLIQTLVIVFLLIISLPLFYLLFSKVLLPLEWKEEPANEEKVSQLQTQVKVSQHSLLEKESIGRNRLACSAQTGSCQITSS